MQSSMATLLSAAQLTTSTTSLEEFLDVLRAGYLVRLLSYCAFHRDNARSVRAHLDFLKLDILFL